MEQDRGMTLPAAVRCNTYHDPREAAADAEAAEIRYQISKEIKMHDSEFECRAFIFCQRRHVTNSVYRSYCRREPTRPDRRTIELYSDY